MDTASATEMTFRRPGPEPDGRAEDEDRGSPDRPPEGRKATQDKMHSKAGDLRLLWLEKTPDEAKIRATEKEIRALRDQMQDKGTDYRWAAYKVLTPEQQELLKAEQGDGPLLRPRAGRRQGHGSGQRPRHGSRHGPGMGRAARHGRKHEVTARREAFFLDTSPFRITRSPLRRVILCFSFRKPQDPVPFTQGPS